MRSFGKKGSGFRRNPVEDGKRRCTKRGKNREGKISARFSLLASRFRFDFDYTQFHRELENLAQEFGFTVRYEFVP